MNKSVDHRQRLLALALTVVVVLVGVDLFDRVWLGKYVFYQEHLDDLQFRLQRFKALLSSQEELQQSLQQIQQDNSTDAYYLPDASPTLAATTLQQRVRQVVQSNGGNLVSTQILPVAVEEGFTRVALRIQMTGDTTAVQRMLHALESSRPLLFVDALQIRAQPVRQNRRGNTVTEEMQLVTQFELAGYLPGADHASEG